MDASGSALMLDANNLYVYDTVSFLLLVIIALLSVIIGSIYIYFFLKNWR